jgi:uncharacterized protein (TIGR02284 family)
LAIGYVIRAAARTSDRSGRGDNAGLIDTLNGLIAISKDGEIGFRTAAEEVKNSRLKDVFNQGAERCAQGIAELQRRVRALGGDPEDSGSTIGALHRRWIDFRTAITDMDDAAILGEVERGEDTAKAAYAAALEIGLPPGIRSMIERQYRGVCQNHDRVRDLRNAPL